jgi:carbohydrate-binding protein
MVYEGGWLIPYLRDQFPNTQYGVVMPPTGPGGEGNLIFTVAWGISANTKNPDAAWKVVKFPDQRSQSKDGARKRICAAITEVVAEQRLSEEQSQLGSDL